MANKLNISLNQIYCSCRGNIHVKIELDLTSSRRG